ncbi:MAG: endonuclease/exonuclease/phosphatase family protein [Lachnospiraceae bacterium]|nr:endonuclease/exonuclease/phosphatase family protein [Lachnospiraceae bacterium]
MSYKIMTFNIQHGVDYNKRLAAGKALKFDLAALTPEQMEEFKKQKPHKEDPSFIDLEQVGRTIAQQGPVFCALNEVRNASHDECYTDQARAIAAAAGMPYFYFAEAIYLGGKGPYGNALVSAWPILSAETVKIPDPEVKDEPAYYETRCLLKATLETPEGGKLNVMVTHMGLAKAEARNAVATVLANLDPDIPTILMGDFNLEPDHEILAPIHETFRSVGDLLPAGTKTYPSDAPDIKIDYIFAHGNVRFVSAEVPAVIVSDHLPHTAVIELG